MSSTKTVVLVTGANSGIGLETVAAVAAASPDYHVLVGSRSVEKGQAAIKELETKNLKGTVSLLQLDVTDEASIKKAVSTVEKEFSKLDVLINNAGIYIFDDSTNPLGDNLRKTLETNTIGPVVTTENFLPLLQKSSDPRIIYVSSILGSIGLKHDKTYWTSAVECFSYRVSKAGLNMVIAYQSVEFAKIGIKVFGVCPGYVVTNLDGATEEARAKRVAQGAGSPEVSGQTILTIVDGRRDEDVGLVIHKDGVYSW